MDSIASLQNDTKHHIYILTIICTFSTIGHMTDSRFEWDEKKNRENSIKHGVSFEQAKKAFHDPDRIITLDAEHSTQEQRYFCIGYVSAKIITVRFTKRGKIIRIFGAGYWRRGKRLYETLR